MKAKKILMIIFGVIALAINVYIMVEAFTGVEESAKTSMGVSEAIIKFVEDINPSSHIGDDPKKVHDVVRKLFGHFLLFGASGLFTGLTLVMLDDVMVDKKVEVTLAGLSLGLVVSIFSEIAQIITPGRYGLFTDVLIDFLGFSVFFEIVFLITYLIYRKKKGKKE